MEVASHSLWSVMVLKNIRVIAKLDVKAPNLVKGIQLEGLRKLGDPNDFARKYYEAGIDEIIYLDIVASLYNRNSLADIVCKATRSIFIPITVGGGIRSIDDARRILRAGADKIAINTAAIKNPDIVRQVAEEFGSQCMVSYIEAKKYAKGKWEAYYDCGRERTGLDVCEWAQQVSLLGAGEILLTSVDRDGTGQGFDLDLIRNVTGKVSIPVIACGGMGKPQDLVDAVIQGDADAVASAYALHYNRCSVADIKNCALKNDINVREV